MTLTKGIHWDLFTCNDSFDGKRQIQAIHECKDNPLKNDLQAIEYVIKNKDSCKDCANALLGCDDKMVKTILARG